MTRAVWLALALACTTCGPRSRMLPPDAPVPWQKSGIDWTHAPSAGLPAPFRPQRVETFTLANGVRVVAVHDSRLPLVAIDVVVASAGSRFDRDQPGIAALTAELLAPDSDALERAGVRLEVRATTDATSLAAVTTSTRAEQALAQLAALLQSPRFDAAAVERVRAQRIRELEQHGRRPRTVAAQVFDRVVFGSHPYALPAEGTAPSVRALTAGDVRAFWTRAYRPDQVTVIVAGDVPPRAAQEWATAHLGAWRATPAPSDAAPALAPFVAQVALVDAPGAAQSVIMIGRRAAAAGARDQLAGDVATSIVGGGIGARLDRELHDRLGLTIGASASFWRGQLAGSWGLATTFAREKTVTGIRAALAVIDKLRGEPVSADELAVAKGNLRDAARQLLDTDLGRARALERLVAQGLPVDWYATYDDRLAAVTASDVRTAAAAWQDLAIVIVGDRTALEPQLAELGLPIAHYAPDGTARP